MICWLPVLDPTVRKKGEGNEEYGLVSAFSSLSDSRHMRCHFNPSFATTAGTLQVSSTCGLASGLRAAFIVIEATTCFCCRVEQQTKDRKDVHSAQQCSEVIWHFHFLFVCVCHCAQLTAHSSFFQIQQLLSGKNTDKTRNLHKNTNGCLNNNQGYIYTQKRRRSTSSRIATILLFFLHLCTHKIIRTESCLTFQNGLQMLLIMI